jgi:hypothetical protein
MGQAAVRRLRAARIRTAAGSQSHPDPHTPGQLCSLRATQRCGVGRGGKRFAPLRAMWMLFQRALAGLRRAVHERLHPRPIPTPPYR